jgi:hypothetical protein
MTQITEHLNSFYYSATHCTVRSHQSAKSANNGMYSQMDLIGVLREEGKGGVQGGFWPCGKVLVWGLMRAFCGSGSCRAVCFKHKFPSTERRMTDSELGGARNGPITSVRARVAPSQIMSLRAVQGAPIKEIGGVREHCPESRTILEDRLMLGLHGKRRAPALNSETRRKTQ